MAIISDGDAVGANVVSSWRRRGTDESLSMPTRCSPGVNSRPRFTRPGFHRCWGASDGQRR
jgi:hypothetical protein